MMPASSTVKIFQKESEELRSLSAQLHGKLGAVDMLELLLSSCVYKPEAPAQTFIPPEVYNVYKEKSLWFVDFRVLWTFDALSSYFKKPLVGNNWASGGQFKYRGFRPPAYTEGAALSQHRFGRAQDCDVVGIPAETVRQEIILHPREVAFRYITCIESTVNWLHFDCRNTGSEELLIVKP